MARCLEIEGGAGCRGGGLPRGGSCSGGGFDSDVVDGELWHRCKEEAVGSGGGFTRIPVGGERECGGKKRATPALGTF
jgi:hypothetical protein